MQNKNELKNYILEGMTFGLSIGTCLECVLGILLNKLAICIGFGVSIGLCLGMLIGMNIKKDGNKEIK